MRKKSIGIQNQIHYFLKLKAKSKVCFCAIQQCVEMRELSHLESPELWIPDPDQLVGELELVLKLPQEIDAHPGAALGVEPLRSIATRVVVIVLLFLFLGHQTRHPPVDGALCGDRIWLRHDDERGLLQEGDPHVELVRDSLGGSVTLTGPNNVLDVKTGPEEVIIIKYEMTCCCFFKLSF